MAIHCNVLHKNTNNIIVNLFVLLCLMFFATVANAETCFLPEDNCYGEIISVSTKKCNETTTFSIKQNCLATVDNDYYDCIQNADGCYVSACLYENDIDCNEKATILTQEIQKTYPQNSYYCSKNANGCRGIFLRCDENRDASGNLIPVINSSDCLGYNLSLTEANQHKLSGETCANCITSALYRHCGTANAGYNTTSSVTRYKCGTTKPCLDTYSGCEDATVSSASKATYENNGYTCTACNKTKTTCYYDLDGNKYTNDATTETWYKCEKICTPLLSETECVYGIESCSDGCDGTRTCCTACPYPDCGTIITAKPDNSSYITCVDCSGTHNIDWTCNIGYSKAENICVKDCIYTDKCLGYTLASADKTGTGWIINYCTACEITKYKASTKKSCPEGESTTGSISGYTCTYTSNYTGDSRCYKCVANACTGYDYTSQQTGSGWSCSSCNKGGTIVYKCFKYCTSANLYSNYYNKPCSDWSGYDKFTECAMEYASMATTAECSPKLSNSSSPYYCGNKTGYDRYTCLGSCDVDGWRSCCEECNGGV